MGLILDRVKALLQEHPDVREKIWDMMKNEE